MTDPTPNNVPTPRVSARITSVETAQGQTVPVPRNGVVLLVGPNNAGKSRILKDLRALVAQPNDSVGVALKRLALEKEVSGDFGTWLQSRSPHRIREGAAEYRVSGWGDVNHENILAQWNNQVGLGPITELFVLFADGATRLTAGDAQGSIDFANDIPSHPVQRAYLDVELEGQLDTMSRAAFGLGVTVDRYGGAMISLRLGERPEFVHEQGVPTREYLSALRLLPTLQEQGDGVRSYLGLLLFVLAGKYSIILVDEPEAFLHPPQARRLGGILAEPRHSQQAFIATHSTDIVQGALEAQATTTIIRVTRDGGGNHLAVLPSDAVRELWSDSILRYSNVLDGLFHDAVVVCESDSDCRYYSALLDGTRAVPPAGGQPTPEPQLLFTHCGGKARLATVVTALRGVSVPVVVIADFDLLRDFADVERVVRSLGGDPEEFRQDVKVVSDALSSDVKPLRRITLRDEFIRKIDEPEGELVDQREADQLRSLLRPESGWDKAKRAGIAAVPQGDASSACMRLLANLATVGVLVVPVGELERFAPEVSSHGPQWVSSVLERGLHAEPSAAAAEFSESIRRATRAVSGYDDAGRAGK